MHGHSSQAFETVDALYIADGHHRAASAARARDARARFGRGRISFWPSRFRQIRCAFFRTTAWCAI